MLFSINKYLHSDQIICSNRQLNSVIEDHFQQQKLLFMFCTGNEAGHHKLKEDTSANRLAATPPPDVVYSYTNLLGIEVPFVGMCFCDYL